MMFLKRLKRYFLVIFLGNPDPPVVEQPKISLLIPFTSKNKDRNASFNWLVRYWRNELPEAEIVVGTSKSRPFCKGEALNDAARKATGKVLVIIDADAYLDGVIIDTAANEILENIDNHLWLVPYRRLYRLTKQITREILQSDPRDPMRVPDPPPEDWVQNQGHSQRYGHRYGAMIMMFPREALDVIGCFDERFKGWGGEDVALVRALDTLWGKHKSTDNSIFHLWHNVIGKDYRTRSWEGQKHSNAKLAMRYHRASRKPSEMRELVKEACKFKRHKGKKK